MFGSISKASLAMGLVGGAFLAMATPSFAGADVATYASIGPDTSVPFGWIDFCLRYQGECPDDALAPRNIELTANNLNQIQRINAWVNHAIEPVADTDHWGAIDQWDYPSDGKGDCEDYALLKRRMLMEQGFPRQALLMTVVKDAHAEGHAVLTVVTDHGEFVLDNMNDLVKPWTQAGYRFVKRQSLNNQNVWVAIGPPTSEPLYVSK
ncbi:MAG: transglutaminase-like cysteine peptidase [Methylocystis sp.]|nr:transglutaminase-like cysteine peptidase [Methylocystis sp.]MBI3275208.1 transglutaminase-like cysteine peptidase [Methylocystis sp.]